MSESTPVQPMVCLVPTIIQRPLDRGVANCFAIIASFAIATCVAVSVAGEDQPERNEAPISYRRVYVPADNPAAWPRGEEKYLPIEVNDFNTWVEAANKTSKSSDAAGINVAEYAGRLEEDGRLEGHGRWDVVMRSGEPTFLRLLSPSIVITDLHWKGADRQAAQFGVWGKTGGLPAECGLLITKSGSIEFDWSARGHQQNGKLEVPWRVPNATSNRVALDLPTGQQPTIDGAVILERARVESSESDRKPRERWKLAMPASADATLQIVGSESKKIDSAERPSFQETVSYLIQRRGLNISATWSLDFRDSRQHDVTMPLPNGVELTSVTVDGHAVNWRVENGESPAGAKAIISLPPARDTSAYRIELAAWQPLTVDRSWQLPVLHPESVFWSAGQVDLELSPDLELRNVSATDCAQKAVKASADDNSVAQSLSFAAYSPSAALEVLVSGHDPEAAVRMCSSLALVDPDVTGKLATEWNTSQGNLYIFSGELSPGWNVEAVETIPTDALAEWFIDRSGERQTLKVQLTHPATPGHSVTVIVNGRLQRKSLAEPLLSDLLRVVHWNNVRVLRHLVAFQSTEQYVAGTIGDLPTVPRDEIGESERALLDINANNNQVVDLTQASHDSGLRLELRRAEYKAELELETDVVNNELRQNWRISARPTANAVDRVLVYATSPLGDNARWIERSTNNPVVAKLISPDDSRRKDLPKNGEVWLLRVSQPTSKLIELGVSIASPLSKRSPLPLLSLPQANEQHGAVHVHGLIGNAFSIESTGLVPIPVSAAEAKPSASDNGHAVRAAFRYAPSECLDITHAPTLSIAPLAGSGIAPFIVSHLNVESFYWPDGKAQHCAIYDLVSDGATEFRPQLPGDAKLNAVIVNHQFVDVAPLGSPAAIAPIPISVASRRNNIKIYFETRHAPLGSVSKLVAPIDLHDLPVVAREWNVWLPQGFATENEDYGSLNWRRRLFGPLANSDTSKQFNPLQMMVSSSNVGGDPTSGEKASIISPASVGHSSRSSVAHTTSSEQIGNSMEDASSDEIRGASVENGSFANPIGWHRTRQTDLADGTPTPLFVTRAAAISAWEAAAVIITFMLFSLCAIRGRWLFVAMAIVALLAITLPNAIAPLATGALWGIVLSAIKLVGEARAAPKNTSFSTVARAIAVGGFATLFAIVPRSAIADPGQNPLPSSTNLAGPAEPVLIPIDADKKPVGSKYFVGERFLHSLLDRQTDQHALDHTWLLREATYVGELSDARDTTEVTVGRWSLAFSIETLARDTTISLPLKKEEANWEVSAMLEGVPVPLVWRNGGHECTLEVAQPGSYTLTLFCTPKSADTGDRRKLALSIPELASARIQVRIPALLPGVNIAEAIVVPPAKDASRMVSGELVQASQIVVDWPRTKEKNNASQGLNVAELKWLRVDSNGAELETKYILEGGNRRPSSLSVKYDPRWTLVTRFQNASSDQAGETVDGLRTLSIPLDASDNDRQEVVVRWKLEGAPALGYVRLPPIYLSSALVTQRWLALSIGSNLDCTLDDNNASAATTNEFMARWGTATDAPPVTAVVANIVADRALTLAIRPREFESSFREVLHVAAGSQRLRVIYEANVVPANAERFALRLAVPEKLSIDAITLTEADGQIPTHWVRDGNDHVNVFFDSAAHGEYRLTLTGTCPSGVEVPIRLPRISASPAGSAMQVQIYRDDDVEVKLQHLPKAADSKTAAAELPPIQWLVRPVGTFRLNDKEFQSAQLALSRGQCTLNGDTVTSLSHEAGGWWVTFNMHITSDGNLDVLRLRFPPACAGPLEVESSAPETKEIVASSDGTQDLAIRFTSTVTQKNAIDLRIRSSLAVLAGAAIEVPSITIATPFAGHNYLTVPTTFDNNPLIWSEVGVQSAIVPQQLMQGNLGAQTQYEIVKSPFAVSARLHAAKQTAPRVRLADTSVAVGTHGAQTVISSFVISPGGIAECMIKLPSDQRLLSAELDGRDALVIRTANSMWRVALSTTQLPQVLEIVSCVEPPQSPGQIHELRRPTLFVGQNLLSVEVSLWSISKPAESDRIAIVGASPVSAIDQAALRFDRLVSIAESASSAAAEAPQPDGANWFRPWAARLEAVHRQSMQLVGQSGATAALARLPRASEEQLGHIAGRYDKWLEESIDLFGNEAGSFATLTSDLLSAKDALPDQQTTYFASDGDADKLVVQAIKPAEASTRVKSVAAIVVILAAGLWLSRIPGISDFLYRFPYVAGVLLGIAYWAWLTPSWLGLVVAAVSACFALRFNWPGQYLRAEASTVLRSTRTS